MSIRLRLTLWYAGVLAVVLLSFSGLFHWILATSLYAEVDRILDYFTRETHRALGYTAEESWLEHTAVVNLEAVPVNEFASPGVYIQVLDNQGRVLAMSDNLRSSQLPVDPTVIQEGLAGVSVRATLIAGGQERVRVLTTPVIVQGKVVGLVQVAESLHTVDDTMAKVRFLLATGVLLSLAVAMLMGWLLAHRALQPVAQIAATARRIVTAQDLSQRLSFQGVRDEIGLLAETFNAMLSRLEDAFRSQQQFIADSSHELRTPLTIIRGNLDLLKRSNDPANQAESLAAIEGEVKRMAAIVDDLLFLAQLEAPRPGRFQLLDLDAIVAAVYRAVRPIAGERDLSLGPVEPVQVRGDADQLERMLLNLVDNALKYTPPGGKVEIRIGVQTVKPMAGGGPSRYATVSVSDTGPGIAPEHLPHLFERFYRIDKARSRQAGGTGLGLAIVKGVAEAHGGWVTVESQVGKGSTFTVWLPMN